MAAKRSQAMKRLNRQRRERSSGAGSAKDRRRPEAGSTQRAVAALLAGHLQRIIGELQKQGTRISAIQAQLDRLEAGEPRQAAEPRRVKAH
jgi:hypothetical protein